MDNSIHSHTAQPFLMPPDGKFLSSGSFNFSMAALAADSAALAGNHWGKLQNIEYI
jgi:histidine ammonia-lyase